MGLKYSELKGEVKSEGSDSTHPTRKAGDQELVLCCLIKRDVRYKQRRSHEIGVLQSLPDCLTV